MSDIYVGTYETGYEYVRIYLMAGTGATTDLLVPDKGVTVIKIGADQSEWHRAVSALVHEAQEMAMHRLNLSYSPNEGMNNSTANIMFVLDHEQFHECCCRTGDLLASSLPDLAVAWKKWQLNQKKKGKNK